MTHNTETETETETPPQGELSLRGHTKYINMLDLSPLAAIANADSDDLALDICVGKSDNIAVDGSPRKGVLAFTCEAATGFELGESSDYSDQEVFTLELPSCFVCIPISDDLMREIKDVMEKKFG